MKLLSLRNSLLVLGGIVVTGVLWWGRIRERPCDDGCETASQPSKGVACRLDAFTPEERNVHSEDTKRLMKEVRETRELADGWELRISPSVLADVGHWFVDERKCCPFLSLEIVLVSEATLASVRLRGPEGTKDILRPVLNAQP